MPGYPFLARTPLRIDDIAQHLTANRGVGVPYSDEMIANARADLQIQANPEADGVDAFKSRYPNAAVRDFDTNPGVLSEMDAIVAYLQMLGTLVDFKTFDAARNAR
jgi:cytochrome c oxidase cbb3-type subunit 2